MLLLAMLGSTVMYAQKTTLRNDNQFMTDVVAVNLYGYPNYQQLQEFLSDYDEILASDGYRWCDCNYWYFLFNGYLVDRDALVETLNGDDRVHFALLTDEYYPNGFRREFDPRSITIRFIENTTDEDVLAFVARYQEYRFRGWSWCHESDAMIFTFDYNLSQRTNSKKI